MQKAIHAERKAEAERDLAEIKQQVAEQYELPLVDGAIQIPDAGSPGDIERTAVESRVQLSR